MNKVNGTSQVVGYTTCALDWMMIHIPSLNNDQMLSMTSASRSPNQNLPPNFASARHLSGYGRFPFPLAELSLEGNPLEAPVFAAITNALQQLCPGPSYYPSEAYHKGEAPKQPPWRHGETTVPGTTPVTVTVPQALLPLRRTQSQPHLVEAASEIEERQALSEGDMDDGEVPDRSEIIQEFQEAWGMGKGELSENLGWAEPGFK